MSVSTPIQWSDSVANPTMGCIVPCELQPSPAQLKHSTVEFFRKEFRGSHRETLDRIISEQIGTHNATEIFQICSDIADAVINAFRMKLDGSLRDRIKRDFGMALQQHFICYAHGDHL